MSEYEVLLSPDVAEFLAAADEKTERIVREEQRSKGETQLDDRLLILTYTNTVVQIDINTNRNKHPRRNSIGYTAQNTSIDRELTATENLQYACQMYHVPKPERATRIADLLRLVDLEDVADEQADTFSGEMQNRLDIAMSLVHRPPLVFLDKPTTGLDPNARLRLWEYFRDINTQGTTIVLTTQYLEEADQLCDRLAVRPRRPWLHRHTIQSPVTHPRRCLPDAHRGDA
jgi:ABC-type Na+ transport system ATPase subunit NatA